MTTIKFQKLRWSPHSHYGYATGRILVIHFPTKEQCDEWVKESNNAYKGCTQYVSLPYVTPSDFLNAEISHD